jgi:hypothetical protein
MTRWSIHQEGAPVTHERDPEDDPHSHFRRTLCGRWITPDRSYSQRPIDDRRDDVDCPDCKAARE